MWGCCADRDKILGRSKVAAACRELSRHGIARSFDFNALQHGRLGGLLDCHAQVIQG